MLILIFFLFLILAFWIAEKIDEDFASVVVFFDIGVLIAIVIVSICLFNCTYRIDEEIKVYEEENAVIEKKLENAVELYMQYEKEIMISVAPDTDTISLISLYPDLKSDKLVESEMEAYIQNNNKIKELKAERTKKSTYKFLLFFGH